MTTTRTFFTRIALPLFAFLTLALALTVAPRTARAEATAASATSKACTSVENRLPVGESTKFKKGDRIFVWSEIKGAEGQSVEHVWKKDGTELRRARFNVTSGNWHTNSRVPSAAAGSYVVDVVMGDKVIGSVSFTVE